ncbi:MAG: hypothetical protein WA705_24135 [Candidatus Ozemobacteraceae bacterium]
MFDSLLLLSFVNLLAMLPLYAGVRLAQHMGGQPEANLWESLLASPGFLCLAITLTTSFIAHKLATAMTCEEKTHRWLSINSLVMALIWVLPDILHAPEWLNVALMETWTIGTSILLLLVSLFLPLKMIVRVLQGRTK